MTPVMVRFLQSRPHKCRFSDFTSLFWPTQTIFGVSHFHTITSKGHFGFAGFSSFSSILFKNVRWSKMDIFKHGFFYGNTFLNFFLEIRPLWSHVHFGQLFFKLKNFFSQTDIYFVRFGFYFFQIEKKYVQHAIYRFTCNHHYR